MGISKKQVSLIVLILLIGTAIGFGIYIFKPNEISKKNKAIEISKEKKQELKLKLEKKSKIEKKHEGKAEDNAAPVIKNFKISSNLIDYTERIFPNIYFESEDESGTFRARLQFYYREKLIGYMQENPNTKKTNIPISFFIDEYTILEDLKTFKDFEGAKIDYELIVWDNNMQKGIYKAEDQIEVKDNTSPSAVRVFWTFFYNEDNDDIELYNKDVLNTFVLYHSKDLPEIPDNKIKKYEYGLTTTDGALLYKSDLEVFEEKKTDINLNIEGEGKFYFYTRAYDLSDNYSEKKINVYLDQSPPIASLNLGENILFPSGRTAKALLSAKDNLSGVTKYRLAISERQLYYSSWQDFDENKESMIVDFKVPNQEGSHNLWCQVMDKAGNETLPFRETFYAKNDPNLRITSKFNEREQETNLDKNINKTGIKIKSVDEK